MFPHVLPKCCATPCVHCTCWWLMGAGVPTRRHCGASPTMEPTMTLGAGVFVPSPCWECGWNEKRCLKHEIELGVCHIVVVCSPSVQLCDGWIIVCQGLLSMHQSCHHEHWSVLGQWGLNQSILAMQSVLLLSVVSVLLVCESFPWGVPLHCQWTCL